MSVARFSTSPSIHLILLINQGKNRSDSGPVVEILAFWITAAK